MASALHRITFSEESSTLPLHSILETCSRTFAQYPHARPIVVLGRSRRMAVGSHATELNALLSATGAALGSETAKTMGDVGTAMVAKNIGASLLVLQASSA